MNWSGAWEWIKARLKERSTWMGIFALLSAAGLAIRPDLWDAIASVGLVLVGGTAVVTPDKPALHLWPVLALLLLGGCVVDGSYSSDGIKDGYACKIGFSGRRVIVRAMDLECAGGDPAANASPVPVLQ